MLVTLAEAAMLAGVPRAEACSALNGRHHVPTLPRESVQSIARDLDCVPDHAIHELSLAEVLDRRAARPSHRPRLDVRRPRRSGGWTARGAPGGSSCRKSDLRLSVLTRDAAACQPWLQSNRLGRRLNRRTTGSNVGRSSGRNRAGHL
jgi:hypothetical protein